MKDYLKPPAHLDSRLLEELASAIHPAFTNTKRPLKSDEVSLSAGIRVNREFPDPKGVLEAAFADFEEFLSSRSLSNAEGHKLILRHLLSLEPEEHVVTVRADGIEVAASDTEGVRRALVWIEDEMLRRGGPYLRLGSHRRKAVIKTRLSRCFFGPINRPPANRDELADDVNYYPKSYLNRLAHEGVNGLWITIKFSESVPSAIIPEYGQDSAKRLAKLQWTVARCARYGIKVYVFCIEPACLPNDSPILRKHPEIGGYVYGDYTAFCTSSEFGQTYLEEATQTLFSKVPELGGMIVIPVGERFTNCHSLFLPESGRSNAICTCPRCQTRSPHSVIHDTLQAFRRGMDQSAPHAELIAWPYGQLFLWGEKMALESSKHLPEGVIIQHNFETGGVVRQLGKDRPLWDYWLSWVGPSKFFAKLPQTTRPRGNRISAKLQVGCSHEIATVPFIPVPGILYQKYKAMHGLGVSSAMQSWYFGNYPSLMTKAAGELSFAPFPKSENEFLNHLAGRQWGTQAQRVAKAWTYFQRAYQHYPATHFFGYYGPMQDGVTWPLHLLPRRTPLAPTWMVGYQVSGDHIADCLSSLFTLREVIVLCERMVRIWKNGMALLDQVASRNLSRAQELEIGVAKAVGLQFESGLAILRFYEFREKLADAKGSSALTWLNEMEQLVLKEIERREQIIPFFQKDGRLGFHSEAENYKVTPKLIRKSISSLKHLLKKEFPTVRKALHDKEDLFADYTGVAPRISPLSLSRLSKADEESRWGKIVAHPLRNFLINQFDHSKNVYGGSWRWHSWRKAPLSAQCQIAIAAEGLAFTVSCRSRSTVDLASKPVEVIVDIKPDRIKPPIQFTIDSNRNLKTTFDDGVLIKAPEFKAAWSNREEVWKTEFCIPKKTLGLRAIDKSFQLNVRLCFHLQSGERCELSLVRRRPLKARLGWGDTNPYTDYRWVHSE